MSLKKTSWKSPFFGMKITAIVLIGIVLISIYLKNNDNGLVFSRTSSNSNNTIQSISNQNLETSDLNNSLISKSKDFSSYRILAYPDKTLDITSFLNHLNYKKDLTLNSKLILVFWATWCSNCKEDLKNTDQYFKNLNNKEIEILAINLDSKSNQNKANKIWSSLNLSFSNIADVDQLSLSAFNLEILPSYAVFKKDKYLYRIEGQVDWSDSKIQSALQIQ